MSINPHYKITFDQAIYFQSQDQASKRAVVKNYGTERY